MISTTVGLTSSNLPSYISCHPPLFQHSLTLSLSYLFPLCLTSLPYPPSPSPFPWAPILQALCSLLHSYPHPFSSCAYPYFIISPFSAPYLYTSLPGPSFPLCLFFLPSIMLINHLLQCTFQARNLPPSISYFTCAGLNCL